MSTATKRRPTADKAPTPPAAPTATLLPSHDLRDMGLASASQQLRASVADLGVVYVARARNDLTKCPVCRVFHEL